MESRSIEKNDARSHNRNYFLPCLTSLFLALIALSAGCCVVEGTLIDTPKGKIRVEELNVGQTVYSHDDAGRVVESTVIAISKSPALGYLEIDIDKASEPLRVTAWHPIKTKSGWTKAGSLSEGTIVQTATGEQSINSIRLSPKLCTVFDLSVEPHRNFIADGVLVHNKSVVMPPTPNDVIGTWYAIGPPSFHDSFLRYDLFENNSATLTKMHWHRGVTVVKTTGHGNWSLDGFELKCEIFSDHDYQVQMFESFEAIAYGSSIMSASMGDRQCNLYRESVLRSRMTKWNQALNELANSATK